MISVPAAPANSRSKEGTGSCRELPIGFDASLSQGLKKALAIFVVAKDISPVVSAVHYVIDSALILDSKFSGHRGMDDGKGFTCQALAGVLDDAFCNRR